jgi:dipeptidyl aminopeptidase/acylaminoacyl peptidase
MYGFGGGAGSSAAFIYETGQLRIGASLWQRPDLFIQNSPVLNANKVSTPLLMMHNHRDASVPFEQAVEFFTALRRLGKRVWLLQYDEGSHIVDVADAMDYTVRVTQFFDYYLKGALPPIWMTEGIPARSKGIKTGYDLDVSGKTP